MRIDLDCYHCNHLDPWLDDTGHCPACGQLPGQLALTDLEDPHDDPSWTHPDLRHASTEEVTDHRPAPADGRQNYPLPLVRIPDPAETRPGL